MQLELNGVCLQHGQKPIVDQVSFSLPQGELGCLLGPSGGGKTSLLRAIAGFHPLAAGQIQVGGELLSRPGYTRDPAERGIGMVFQDLALLPHLNVADNIGFGLFRLDKNSRRQRIGQMLELTGLEAQARQYPHALSGGQQQRVALARALAPRPKLLLLDEPFSSLDNSLRLGLATQVRDIVAETGTTTLLVTHDLHEAFAMATKVGVLAGGQLRQWASPYDLYHRPVDRLVAEFVGDGVWLPGTLDPSGQVRTELGVIGALCTLEGHVGAVDILLRPDDIVHDDASPLSATILDRAFRGANILYRLQCPSGQALKTLVPSHHNHAIGEDLGIRLDVEHLIAFPKSTA